MTETRDSPFLQRLERDCESIPEWLASNPGWHRWSDLMKQFVGYQPPNSKAIRDRLERAGLIQVVSVGTNGGGRAIKVARPKEGLPPPSLKAARRLMLVDLAEAFRRMEEHTRYSVKSLERIAELMEHLVHNAVVYHPNREGAVK